MKIRPARLALVGLLVLMIGPYPTASETEPATVEEKIDRITEPPEYDWLRQEKKGAGGSLSGVGETSDVPARSASKTGGDGGCGFSPSTSPPSANRSSKRASASCDRGSSRCGASPIGGCDCGAPVGSCAAPSVGAFSALGYLVLGIFLAALIGFAVWSVIKRRDGEPEDAETELGEMSSPEDLGPSDVARFSVDAIMARARAAAERGDFRSAVGFAYLAGIDHLHRTGVLDLRRSTTNLQIVEAASRIDGLRRPTATLVRLFEDLFFGGKAPLLAHFETCRHIVEEELVRAAPQE